MNPATVFYLSIRMETTVLVSAGTKGKDCGFTFPLFVDNTTSYQDFRAAICAKYPRGLFDAVEMRYRDSSKLCWVPIQCDSELGVMFASNAQTMSCNLEITMIQRTGHKGLKTHQLLGPLHLGHLVLIPLLEGQGLAIEVGQ